MDLPPSLIRSFWDTWSSFAHCDSNLHPKDSDNKPRSQPPPVTTAPPKRQGCYEGLGMMNSMKFSTPKKIIHIFMVPVRCQKIFVTRFDEIFYKMVAKQNLVYEIAIFVCIWTECPSASILFRTCVLVRSYAFRRRLALSYQSFSVALTVAIFKVICVF